MTFVLVERSTGKQVDRASTISELEAAKHSLSARTERPLDSWTVLPLADFNAFKAEEPTDAELLQGELSAYLGGLQVTPEQALRAAAQFAREHLAEVAALITD